jgi:hypothetical protein
VSDEAAPGLPRRRGTHKRYPTRRTKKHRPSAKATDGEDAYHPWRWAPSLCWSRSGRTWPDSKSPPPPQAGARRAGDGGAVPADCRRAGPPDQDKAYGLVVRELVGPSRARGACCCLSVGVWARRWVGTEKL